RRNLRGNGRKCLYRGARSWRWGREGTQAVSEDRPSSETRKIDLDKLAVALAYERGRDSAPLVTAKGKGFIAEQIVKLARENGVEIREDADLVTLLSRIDIGEPIPVEAYMAVAEILSYIYRTNAGAKKDTK